MSSVQLRRGINYKTIRKNIGKIDGSYINTPAGKYYGGRYTDIPMYACSEKCIPAVQCFGYFCCFLCFVFNFALKKTTKKK
jgi:hypothetical protein